MDTFAIVITFNDVVPEDKRLAILEDICQTITRTHGEFMFDEPPWIDTQYADE